MLKRGNRRNAPRSRTGCSNCRKKRVKCDETRPSCGQYRKANQSCRILDSIFRPHPYTFVVPGNVTGDDHHGQDEQIDLDPAPTSPDTVAFPQENGASSSFDVIESEVTPAGDLSEEANVERSGTWGNVILNDIARSTGLSQPSPAQQHSPEVTTASQSLVDHAEVSYFIRCYAESVAKGLDIFSEVSYFTHRVLVLSRESALVRFAACAVAAKQLGHVRRLPDQPNTSRLQQSIRKTRERDLEGHDFLWYGAKYYGKAIHAMATEISGRPIAGLDSSPSATEHVTSPRSQQDSTEARLVAVALISMYEELNASWKAWSRHVDGMFQLLRLDQIEKSVTSISSLLPALSTSVSLKSLFWSFARNDLEESFFTSRQTRVNTEALRLWREMGVPINERGELTAGCFLSLTARNAELTALQSLMWLFSRTVNYIATKVRSSSSPDTASLLSPGALERTGDSWSRLDHEVNQWSSEVPLSFQPDIVIPQGEVNGRASRMFANEAWFSNDVCTMAMIYHHTIRILLTLHKPPKSVANAAVRPDWLHLFRSVRRELEHYAKDLLAIVAGRPSDAVRIHLLQPLYVAGRCLNEETDQRELVMLLKGLEQDLGIATGYRVEALVREWGNPAVHGASELDAELSDISSDD